MRTLKKRGKVRKAATKKCSGPSTSKSSFSTKTSRRRPAPRSPSALSDDCQATFAGTPCSVRLQKLKTLETEAWLSVCRVELPDALKPFCVTGGQQNSSESGLFKRREELDFSGRVQVAKNDPSRSIMKLFSRDKGEEMQKMKKCKSVRLSPREAVEVAKIKDDVKDFEGSLQELIPDLSKGQPTAVVLERKERLRYYPCSLCGFSSIGRQKLGDHLRSNHGQEPIPDCLHYQEVTFGVLAPPLNGSSRTTE